MNNYIIYAPIDDDESIRVQGISFHYGYKWVDSSQIIKPTFVKCLLMNTDTKFLLYSQSDAPLRECVSYCNGYKYNYIIIKNINELKIKLNGGIINYNTSRKLIYD